MTYLRIRGLRMELAVAPRIRTAFATLLVLAGSLLLSTAAQADFRVCNATQSLVGVGIGYRAKAGWITEGWWHIEGSTCKTLIEGPLSSRFYYLYAEDAERGGRWDGQHVRCGKRVQDRRRQGLLCARIPARRFPGI